MIRKRHRHASATWEVIEDVAAEHAEGVDREVRALRLELDQSSQGLLALHAELTDQQEELERARAVAEQATQDKSDFLANMSHEIRSPMNAVVGFTSLLRATALTSEQDEYVEAIEAAGTHLLGVIEGILDLSRIESGLLELEDVPFDLFACVEDAVDLLAVRASEKNVALAALFAPGMPARIMGDALRLRQVLVNLLANAVKFTTHGHVAVEVTQRPAAGDSCELAFHIRDTGTGIPAERIGQLFAPYAQSDASTARSHGGTGLGLAICRQLAERMGGAITVESVVGEGSTFTCTIPAQVAGLSPAATDSDRILSGAQVLLVSDRALCAEAIGRHLSDWGAEVVTAQSIDAAVAGEWPRAALAIIDANEPAALIRDIARLTAAAANPELPIVCVATTACRAALARAGELRPSVRTPVRRDHLRKAALAALGHSRKPSQTASAAAPGLPDGTCADDRRGIPPGDLSPDKADARLTPAVPPPTRHVLYVDDNTLLTRLAERIFAADPAVIMQTAPDGKTGLDMARQQRPDIILLDLGLSDMSGEALLGQLRADARTRPIPAVIVSGDIAPATIERLTDLGAAAYLTKPFTASQLREVVNTAGGPSSPPDGVAPLAPQLRVRVPAGRESAGRDGAPRAGRDAQQRLVLADHGLPVLVPVRVLPGDGAVVVDQGVGGLRRVDHFASPSTCTHGPSKSSESTSTLTRESRRALRILARSGYVEIMIRPPVSTPHVTGDACGRPSARVVSTIAWWRGRMKSISSSRLTVVLVAIWGLTAPPYKSGLPARM